MALEYTTSPQKVAPSAADGISVTPNGVAWVNSDWQELIASTSAAIVITGIAYTPVVDDSEFEVEIGKGALGSETVVGALRGRVRNVDHVGLGWLWFPLPIDNIASGQRVAVRMRKDNTSTAAWKFALTYWEKPLAGGTVTTTAKPSKTEPSGATGVSITPSGTAWANSIPWTQLIASTGAAWVLGAIVVKEGTTQIEYEIDVGVGGAGSEAVVTTLRTARDASLGTGAGGPYVIPLWPLLDNIGSGQRVAVRLRKQGTSTLPWTVAAVYYEKPL